MCKFFIPQSHNLARVLTCLTTTNSAFAATCFCKRLSSTLSPTKRTHTVVFLCCVEQTALAFLCLRWSLLLGPCNPCFYTGGPSHATWLGECNIACVCLSLSMFRSIAVFCFSQKLCVQYGVGIPSACLFFLLCSMFLCFAHSFYVVLSWFADLVKRVYPDFCHYALFKCELWLWSPKNGFIWCLWCQCLTLCRRGVPCRRPLRELHFFVARYCLHWSAFAELVRQHPPDIFHVPSIVFIKMHSPDIRALWMK